MEEIKNVAFTACCAFVVGEIIYYLTPKSKITDCIYALLYTVIIIMVVSSISGVDFNLDEYVYQNEYQDEIDERINQYYAVETEKELKKIIINVLDVIHIECENIDIIIDELNNSIIIHEIKVTLKYKSDVQNAKVILLKVLGDEIPVEVTSEV